MSEIVDKIMQRLAPHFKYDAAKKIHVYFIPAIDQKQGGKIYFYAIASSLLHNKMMECLEKGDIPDFAVIVEKGSGEPGRDVKTKIKAYYGFDHDHYTS